jgi:hypothetical protein
VRRCSTLASLSASLACLMFPHSTCLITNICPSVVRRACRARARCDRHAGHGSDQDQGRASQQVQSRCHHPAGWWRETVNLVRGALPSRAQLLNELVVLHVRPAFHSLAGRRRAGAHFSFTRENFFLNGIIP